MKTKIKIMLLMAVLASLVFLKTRTDRVDHIEFMNIEALADPEGNSTTKCIYTGSVDCPAYPVKVYMVY